MKNIDQKGFSALDIVLGVALVAAIGVAGYFAYQASNSPKSTKVDSGKETIASPSPLSSSPKITHLEVNELGVRFDVGALPSLKYKYIKNNNGDPTAILYTDSLAKYCSPDAEDSPLGVVFRVSGQYPAGPLLPGTLIKQYDTYFVSYRRPQQACTNDTAGIQLQTEQQKIVDSVVKSAQPLQ